MKTKSIALCGVLGVVSSWTAAFAQNPPPTDPPAGEPPPPSQTVPAETPPPVVEIKQEPAQTTVTVAPRQEADDGEVKEPYRNAGLLFNLNNVFVQPGILGGWQGFGFGAQKTLGSGSVARIGLNLSRVTDPVNIVKTTRTNGDMEVVSYDIQLPASGFTGQHAFSAVLDFIKPMTKRSIAPYLGAGVFLAYSRQTLSYVDDLTVTDMVTETNNSANNLSLGVRGILGVGWKLNERFSLFAEYQLGLQAIAWQTNHTEVTTNNTASGTAASNRVESDFKETRILNLSTGLGQGGALGLVAHF
jgi:hypothetical protein